MSGNFSVEDPPNTNDPNLPDVAKFLRVQLRDEASFFKFGAELVSDKRTSVRSIQQDETKPELEKKCLELVELWISSVEGRKWQDLTEAARKSGFGGLATDLAAEFGSQKEPQNESAKVANGGNYKYIINFCVLASSYFCVHNVHVVQHRDFKYTVICALYN